MPPENDPPRRLTPLNPPSLDERLERLEQVVFEGEDLAHAVARLGMNASALGEALLTVDKNQQMLTRLGRQLEEVEKASATKDDLHTVDEQHRSELVRYRRTVVARAYTASVVVLALLFAIGLAVANDIANRNRAAYAQCVMAAQQRDAVVNYLTKVTQFGTVVELRESAQRVIKTLPPLACERSAF